MDQDEDEIQKKVLMLFMINGHNHREYLEQETIEKILDERSFKIFGLPFKRDLLHELIDKCKQSLSLNPDNFGMIVRQAYETLTSNIHEGTKQGGHLDSLQHSIEEKQEEKMNLKKQQRSPLLSSNSNREFALESEIKQLKEELEQLQHDLKVFENQALILQKIFIELNLFEFEAPAAEVPAKNPYASLIPKIIYVNFFGLCLQAFTSNLRPSFMCVLFYIHAFYLMFVGYYTRKSGGLLIFQNLFSLIFDLGYFALVYLGFLKPQKHCIGTEAFLVLIYMIFLIISMISRVVELVLLYPFRQPPHETSLILFKILGHEFKLRKRIKIKKNHYYGSS